MKLQFGRKKKHENEVNWYHQLVHLKKQSNEITHVTWLQCVRIIPDVNDIPPSLIFFILKDASGAQGFQKTCGRTYWPGKVFKSHFPFTQRNSIYIHCTFEFLLNKGVHGLKKY